MRMHLTLVALLGFAFPALAEPARIVERDLPAGWEVQDFRGFGYALPPGWIEMERTDEQIALFGGDPGKMTGPGFGLMLDPRPMQVLTDGTWTEAGETEFPGGMRFRTIHARETPQPGLTVEGELLVSVEPVQGDAHLVILQSAFNTPFATHEALFDQLLSALRLPAPGAARLPALAGAFRVPLPPGWDTGTYSESEALNLRRAGLPGKITLMRHPAATDSDFRSGWYMPSDIVAQPVTMLGQPALLYEWQHDPKGLNDGTDSEALIRLFIFETCLPGPDTASIAVDGLPSFHSAAEVQDLIAGIAVDVAAPCGTQNLPAGAVTGTPPSARADGGVAGGVPGPVTGPAAPATPATPAQPATGEALGGLVSYVLPAGWAAIAAPDSVTLMPEDGRGYVTLARGAAVLPPGGLAGMVPQGKISNYESLHGQAWSYFAWTGERAEFIDGTAPAAGWYGLYLQRQCLPGQEPVALLVAGISRFHDGATLKELQRGLTFHWPEGMEDCALKDAGAGEAMARPVPPAAAEDAASDAASSGMPELAASVQPSAPDAGPAAEPVPFPEPAAVAPSRPEPVVPTAPQPVQAATDPDSFTPDPGGYTLYRNARYGSRILYPGSYFQPGPAPDSGDGRSFASADGGARFVVFAQYNALGLSRDEMIEQDIATGGYDKVTYRTAGQGFYVLSGHAAQDIFYRKVLLSAEGLVEVFEITYPARMKEEFDPVVTYMAQSFAARTEAAPPTAREITPRGTEVAPPAARDVTPRETRAAPRTGRYVTPGRDTELRDALMDAARRPIERKLDQPVIFKVSVLRTDGKWAYLQAVPLQPDGAAIDWTRTRFAKARAKGAMSDVAMVLLRNRGKGWRVVDHVLGPTDVHWYAWVEEYRLPEALFRP